MPQVLNFRVTGIPEGAVYVGRGRGSIYGNPFTVQQYGRGIAVEMHKQWLREKIVREPEFYRRLVEDLRGKDLVCWCAPNPCHADLLLHIANL